MTRAQKKEILSSIKILQEAQEKIKKELGKNNYVLARKLLAECQEVAIALGEYIEKLEGEGHVTVTYLEEYCEVVFQIYNDLGAEEPLENKICKKLRKQLIKIESSAKNDIYGMVNIAFFPYKASMWDSLESIYLAAKGDPGCKVYCVPIPYYDLNGDQSFGQMHSEAKKYPDYVEVTDWRSYNLEKEKPDIIYIHNPYDDQNLVTSVPSEYYSANLKKYTDMLIYIPYNVTGGTLAKPYASLWSYYNMDCIIVQHKQQISLFESDISDKVIALGSPKFDKIINLTVTDEMIPESWKDKLKDIVIFLNTGLNGILKYREKSLLKIQYILQIAKEENVTLLWRPHPLLEATIRSMCPELWDIYLETLERFVKYPYGILDRTGDADLAIKISDAYIGEDTSSISHLFGVLGKPLFFIRQGILKELEDRENIKLSCCVSDTVNSDTVWASAAGRNGLLKISKSGVVEEFYIIPNEKDRSNLYGDILINKEKLYLIPRNAREIAVFDIINKHFEKIVLSKPGQKEKFNKGFLYSNKIYLVPRLYEEMVIISCDKRELFYNREIVNELKTITGIPDILVSVNGSSLIEESIYITAPNKPCILEYNIEDEIIRIHRISGASGGFCCMEKVGDKIVLGSMDRCELVIWNPAVNTSTVIREFPKGWNTEEDICFWDIVEIGGDAYIFPRKNDMILKLSVEKLSLISLKKEFPFSITERKSNFFNHPNHFLLVNKLKNGKILVQDANRHGLSEFKEDGSFEWKPVVLTKEEELGIFRARFSKLGANLPWGIYETKYYTVRRLIEYIRQGMHDKSRQRKAFSDVAENLDGTAGREIHGFIMKMYKNKMNV